MHMYVTVCEEIKIIPSQLLIAFSIAELPIRVGGAHAHYIHTPDSHVSVKRV